MQTKLTRLGALPIWAFGVHTADAAPVSALCTVRQEPGGFAVVANAEPCLREIEIKLGVTVARFGRAVLPTIEAAQAHALAQII
jgi:hypothetical protein